MKIMYFGGGIPSTTLLLMSLQGAIPKFDHIIFTDTECELPAVYSHWAWIRRLLKTYQIPFHSVSSGNLLTDALSYPELLPLYVKGELRKGQCVARYKIQPLYHLIDKLSSHQVELSIPITSDDVFRMKESRFPKVKRAWPLIDLNLSLADCIEWLRRHGSPIPSQPACIHCAFLSQKHWNEIQAGDRKSWLLVKRLEETIQSRLPGYSLRYNNGSVPGSLDSSFINECEGLCGV